MFQIKAIMVENLKQIKSKRQAKNAILEAQRIIKKCNISEDKKLQMEGES